ncbi:hypothetical protein CASFOL_034265 [Castilleja foliolosa]|uniref:Uncharacterized protein n=1 Tax=Castilleja foliolosa TaxID=1961234 RepID=A0ABD3BXW6_9LAMI
MGRCPSNDESGLKKGPWTPEEDEKLTKHIQKHGHGSWRALPKLAGLNRCGKSCRLRWTNYLRPDIKRGKFTPEEEQTILNLHAILGNKWSAIATHLPGRTDNEIKNFWNTHLKKKLIQMGFDPMTHRPRTDIFSSLPHLIALAKLIENPTWELEQAMRLHTEAAQMARLNQLLQTLLQPATANSLLLPTNFQNNNNINNMDIDMASHFNLLPPVAGDYFHDTTSFLQLPDLLQVPVVNSDHEENKDKNMGNQGCEFGGGVVMGSPGNISSPWMGSQPPPAVAETSVGDTSSFGGSPMWSELLDDISYFP